MHSLSKILSFPLIILAILIYFWGSKDSLSVWFALPVLLLVVLYVFQGPIDYWGMMHFPPKFDSKILEWLIGNFPPFAALSNDSQEIFKKRLMIYMDSRLFQTVGAEMGEVPADIKAMVAAHGIMMGFYKDDILIGDFDRIYLYKHPFPTPDKPYLHTVETNTEDGVLIFSLEQAINCVVRPDMFYNILYHGYALAFIYLYNDKFSADFENYTQEILAATGFTKEIICTQLGESEIDHKALHIAFYFSHHDVYSSTLPELSKFLDGIFKN